MSEQTDPEILAAEIRGEERMREAAARACINYGLTVKRANPDRPDIVPDLVDMTRECAEVIYAISVKRSSA